MKSYKPDNYNSVSPYILSSDAEKLMTLLENVFDAKLLRRFDRESGVLMHAEMRIDDSILMLSQATEEFSATKSVLHVYVQDAMQIYNRAIEVGFESIQVPVNTEEDPDIRGGFSDFDGNQWWVGTQG